jgi:hypothetical protein
MLGKDTIKEALFDTLGTGDRAWSRRLGRPATRCCWRWRASCRQPCWTPTSTPTTAQGCSRRANGPSRSSAAAPAAEVERRFTRWASARHPGHVDHVLDAQLKAALNGGVGPLSLGGPVLEVDTSGPVDVTAVARGSDNSSSGTCPYRPRRRTVKLGGDQAG